MSILLKLHIKNPPFSKNIQLSCPYFVKNMSILHKHIALMSFFWNFLWKPLLSRPQFVKKTSILSRLHYILWAQKVNSMPVFPISRKKMLSCPCFIEKRPFSKNKLLSCACFVMQTSILSKTLCSDVIFFHILHEKLLLSCPYLVQKNVNSAKTRLYFGPKKSKGCLFFSIFHEK